MKTVDYRLAPQLLIWEVTRACELSCRHCRASAQNVRDDRELTFEQGVALIDEVAAMGTPLIVFTGGDPLQRADLEDLIRHAKARGLIAATIPAATSRLTRERIFSLADAGVDQLAISLDAANARDHDDFRKVDGTFQLALQGAAWIREASVALQINTVFGAWNRSEFESIADLVERLGTVFWEIFFLVPTGRGSDLIGCTPEEFETLFGQISAWSRRSNVTVKVTEAQHYRRFFVDAGGEVAQGRPKPGTIAAKPVNSGNGFCFVDHTGEIQPSGFLPIGCGNVKTDSLAAVYRDHPVFGQLRDLGLVHGPCSRCRSLEVCSGGSRARAYALTGDFLSSDPYCSLTVTR